MSFPLPLVMPDNYHAPGTFQNYFWTSPVPLRAFFLLSFTQFSLFDYVLPRFPGFLLLPVLVFYFF